MKSLFSLAFLLCISTAHGMSCYQCVSDVSWDDCARNVRIDDCPSLHSYCVYGIVNVYNSQSRYIRGCATETDCTSFQTSKECNKARAANPGVYVACQAACCSGYDCNKEVNRPVQKAQLQCYACPPSNNWDDCEDNQRSMTCALDNDRCGSASLLIDSSTVYTKGCVSNEKCYHSGMDCCSKNLCNSGVQHSSSGSVVGVIMVLACSIVAFVR